MLYIHHHPPPPDLKPHINLNIYTTHHPSQLSPHIQTNMNNICSILYLYYHLITYPLLLYKYTTHMY